MYTVKLLLENEKVLPPKEDLTLVQFVGPLKHCMAFKGVVRQVGYRHNVTCQPTCCPRKTHPDIVVPYLGESMLKKEHGLTSK